MGSLAGDAEHLLSFIDNQVMESIRLFETITNDYNEDAGEIDSLVSDFSAISKAAQESAEGTANIADRVQSVVQTSDSVNDSLQDANGIVGRLNDATGKFRL